MSQDSPYAPTPEYGGAPPASASVKVSDELNAPPQMSPFARLGNVFFSPGEVFDDVRRSPRDWWLPIVMLLVIGLAANYVVQQRLGLTPDTLAKVAVDTGLEQQGKTRKDLTDAEKQGVAVQEEWIAWSFKWGAVLGIVFTPIFFGIVTLIYWVLLMIFQAKTTFFRVLAVNAYAFFVPNVVKALLQLILAFVTSPENIDPGTYLQTGGVLTASLAALVSIKEHPVLWTFLSYLDVFSIWFLVLLAIGFAAITVKRMKLGTALAVAVPPYLVTMLIATGFKMLTTK